MEVSEYTMYLVVGRVGFRVSYQLLRTWKTKGIIQCGNKQQRLPARADVQANLNVCAGDIKFILGSWLAS